jgi:hypothetical protein
LDLVDLVKQSNEGRRVPKFLRKLVEEFYTSPIMSGADLLEVLSIIDAFSETDMQQLQMKLSDKRFVALFHLFS